MADRSSHCALSHRTGHRAFGEPDRSGARRPDFSAGTQRARSPGAGFSCPCRHHHDDQHLLRSVHLLDRIRQSRRGPPRNELLSLDYFDPHFLAHLGAHRPGYLFSDARAAALSVSAVQRVGQRTVQFLPQLQMQPATVLPAVQARGGGTRQVLSVLRYGSGGQGIERKGADRRDYGELGVRFSNALHKRFAAENGAPTAKAFSVCSFGGAAVPLTEPGCSPGERRDRGYFWCQASKIANAAPCGSASAAMRPMPSIGIGGMKSCAPRFLALAALASQSATCK